MPWPLRESDISSWKVVCGMLVLLWYATAIALSIPVSTESGESTFSQMKVTKTRLPSSLHVSDPSLSQLMKIDIESPGNLREMETCGIESVEECSRGQTCVYGIESVEECSGCASTYSYPPLAGCLVQYLL